MTDKHFPWQGGMPVGPDVSILEKHWPELNQGDELLYTEIAAVIGFAPGSTRYRSITNAWRARLFRERGILLKCQRGLAFLVATDEQKVADTGPRIAQAGRLLYRQRKVLSTVSTEDERMHTVVEHQGRLLTALERETKRGRMNLIPSLDAPAAPVQIAPRTRSAARAAEDDAGLQPAVALSSIREA